MPLKNLEEIRKYIEENRGKRKFRQSVDLAINFKNIDFSKQENRLNLEVSIPHGKGIEPKIAIFTTDKNIADAAKENGIDVITDVNKTSNDKKELKKLLEYEALYAQPSLMPLIAKTLGQFLGPRGKLPKPLVQENIKTLKEELRNKVVLKSKGKYLPTVHCMIGKEDMKPEEIYDNLKEVVNALISKLGENRIKSIYLKLTMSKPILVYG
ncbi:MAG: hypothetical protein QXL16_00185 [Candidatus Micrarchaeaceae archaeon]